MSAAFLLLGLPAAGCGTVCSQLEYWGNPPKPINILVLDGPWVFGGTINDVNLLGQFFGFTLLDLPLSLAADAVLLPVTIPQQIIGVPEEPIQRAPDAPAAATGSTQRPAGSSAVTGQASLLRVCSRESRPGPP